jgi:hypothetical protein
MREFVARKTAIAAVTAAGLVVAGFGGPAWASVPVIPTVITTGIVLNPNVDPFNPDTSFGFYGYADPTTPNGLQAGVEAGPASVNLNTTGPATTNGAFAFDYQFHLTSNASLMAFTFQDNVDYVGTGANPVNVVLENSSVGHVTGSQVGNACNGCSNDTAGNVVLNYANLTAGYYTLVISGIAPQTVINGLNNGVSIGGSAFVSPVPLPGAILLFGSGVVGLVAFSRRKRAANSN